MLWLGLLARDTGIPASEHLKIRDEVVAFEFDRAITLRLLFYDNEKEKANRNFWSQLVTGEKAYDEDEDVVYDDKYSDSNTQVW